MTTTMKQVQLTQFGSPEVLQLVQSSIPSPKNGEVLVQVQAIGVNFSDILRRQNRYFQSTPLPYVLGSEVVGRVVETGEGVSEFLTLGTTVLAILPFGGAYSEYVVVLADYCIPLPPSIDPKTATGIFVQGSTAQLMLSQVAGDIRNQTVLINAASGGVGSLLVKLAKMAGATVVAAASSDQKLEIAKSNGADFTVNYSHPNWSEQVKALTQGKGATVAFEMVGGDVYNETLKSLAKGAHLIVYGCASGIQGHIHPEYFVDENIRQSGFNLSFYISEKFPLWQEAMGTLIGLIAQGKLTIQTPNTFDLKDAAEAHRLIESRQTTGKVVLTTGF